MPAIFHLTHWKAGSQWIHKILRASVDVDTIVGPELNERQVLDEPIVAGKVYPTVYVTREQFEALALPTCWRAFVVIRDLRDVLISGYFSLRFSHRIVNDQIARWRRQLDRLSVEEGLLRLIDDWLPLAAAVQRSWIGTALPLVRYEDLLDRDVTILEDVLLRHCRLPVDPDKFREIVLAHRFEGLTGGRARGREDVLSHERKGVAGDWVPYFTPRVTRAFAAKFGELVVLSGYEPDDNWTSSWADGRRGAAADRSLPSSDGDRDDAVA
jgi:lipopolysaccharide transport system ATP-binding protein